MDAFKSDHDSQSRIHRDEKGFFISRRKNEGMKLMILELRNKCVIDFLSSGTGTNKMVHLYFCGFFIYLAFPLYRLFHLNREKIEARKYFVVFHRSFLCSN